MLTKHDLIDAIASGRKPRGHWRMGLEHEQFVYNKETSMPLPYDGAPGIKQLLEFLSENRGWDGKKYEGENLIALYKGPQSITIEPAGQFELSGAPHKTIKDMVSEHQNYMQDLNAACDHLGLEYKSIGFPQNWKRNDMYWMPKARYKIMREYMPKRGNLGLDMMTRTCGSQINLDFESEMDMVRKYRVTVALQPIMTALFANSNMVDGQDSGFASYRSHIWEDTDPDRSGILPFIFEDGMSFERYVDYALDVPMYFIERDGQLIDMTGKTFRDFMNGNLPESKDHEATLKDWEDHLTTVFPEVRLKKYLELRGTDSVPAPLLYALAAFWVGLLYTEDGLSEAEELIKNWSIEDHQKFRHDVARLGINTPAPQQNQSIQNFCPIVIDIAERGLTLLKEDQGEGLQYLDMLYPEELKKTLP